MTNATKYYIWLSLALGYSTPKCKALASIYPNITAFYQGGVMEWRLSGVLNDKDISALEATPVAKAYEVIARCNELGISIVSLDDPNYPEKLKDIYDPPAVLYMKGRLPDFERCLSIGIVGTRNATAYGKRTSHVLAGSLAKVGVIIISGGAVGIDSLSHTAALEVGGETLCVLGCGINYPYLMANARMRNTIAERGALISEYPPDYPPGKYTFPERNRIISGLSDGVLVIEAGAKSGSLITARNALEQNRDVFAVMGNITSPYSQGTNALIKDGAIPVTDYTDIISYYPQFRLEGDPDDIVEDVPTHKTDIDPVNVVLQALTELELEGLIKAEKGRMYRL